MKQLSGLDAAFVHQDSARTPMHVCAVLLYRLGAGGRGAVAADELATMSAERLERFPLFSSRLHRLPMDVDAPYWVRVDSPGWEHHITEQTLPGGSGWEGFFTWLDRLHGTRMNLSRPLWEMHLLHGLTGLPGLPRDCQALVFKVHHAAIDGISLAGIINALHQQPDTLPRRRRPPGPAPENWNLWVRAGLNSMGRRRKFAETVRKLVPGVARRLQAGEEFADLPPIRRGKSHFNARVSGARSTGTVLLPREEVLAIKRAAGHVTLNDIALACVSGALRAYLRAHGRLPVDSLSSGVPISLRGRDDRAKAGNRTATVTVGLATQVADPVERLHLIHRFAVAGKKKLDALGTGTIMDISNSVTPSVLAEGIRTLARATELMDAPVPFHVMVSNVPGPQAPMYLGEAELVAPFGLGPVRDNLGLFHIVSGSATLLTLSFVACRRLLPDREFYRRCLQESFGELQQAALASR